MGSNKKVKQKEVVSGKKAPRSDSSVTSSFYTEYPAWSFAKFDVNNEKWGIQQAVKISGELFDKFKSYEGQTWAEIMAASGGRSSGTNSHFITIDQLSTEAQHRWNELKLETFDSVFSLRLTGTHRVFGILENSPILKIVWIDLNHEICPMHR